MPTQVTLWDLLGTPPVEMRKPPRPAVMPLAPATPEPAFPPLTAEDLDAIEHLGKALCIGFGPAHDSLWSAYICQGAAHECIDVPLPARWRDLGCSAVVRVTRTRLGWTSGFSLKGDGYSRAHGGFHHPNQDLMGPFLWSTRQAAIEDGASWLRDACQEKPLARHVAEHFGARGIDAFEGPDPKLQRRLLTREELAAIEKAGPSSEDLALIDPGPSEALLAFERAIGVTEAEDDMPAPEPVPAPADLKITFDMGPFSKAHMRDLCEPSDSGMAVLSPPFTLFEEDEFLGQVVHGTEARALLFRHSANRMRYVLLRFWDDEEGVPHYGSVNGDDDQGIVNAIDETAAGYRLGLRLNLRGAP